MLTAWLQRPEVIAAVNSLTLDSNGIFGELYPSGDVKQADKFVVEVQPLLDALKTSSITSLSLRSTGMGVKGVVAVADVIRAMAAIAVLNISGAFTPFTSSPHSLQCSSPLHPIQQFTPFTSSP